MSDDQSHEQPATKQEQRKRVGRRGHNQPRPIHVHEKPSANTLAKGGMSPLADRKEPNAWSSSTPPLVPGAPSETPKQVEGRAAPSEPIGGWVDASARSPKTPAAADAKEKVGPERPTNGGTPRAVDSKKVDPQKEATEDGAEASRRREGGHPT